MSSAAIAYLKLSRLWVHSLEHSLHATGAESMLAPRPQLDAYIVHTTPVAAAQRVHQGGFTRAITLLTHPHYNCIQRVSTNNTVCGMH
jgi:hypothetical protein